MKTAVVFLALLMMIVALVANESGRCDEAIETFERKMKTLVTEFKASCQSPSVVFNPQIANQETQEDDTKPEETHQGAASCQELHEQDPSLQSGVHRLVFGRVYCHIGNFGCGDGGWTPVMKIDGKKVIFGYDSAFWSSKEVFNSEGGMTGFDQKETMLPSYWSTPLSRICLGMMIHGQINFVVINKRASSLHSLIADGVYRPTSLGRDKWKSLIGSNASLQHHCNLEGFNVVPRGLVKARIGYLANQENDCDTCDSFIGFGSMGDMSCGNVAAHEWSPDNGGRHTTAMGYILVQ